MNNKEEITAEGFLNLNLMEAKEDVEELWVTLKTMGYNHGLELTKVNSNDSVGFISTYQQQQLRYQGNTQN